MYLVFSIKIKTVFLAFKLLLYFTICQLYMGQSIRLLVCNSLLRVKELTRYFAAAILYSLLQIISL